MSRRRSGSTDSLELLLDTMCNTFGGIVFIAMLLAVLAQTTKIAVDPADAAANKLRMETNRLDLESDVARLAAEIDELAPLGDANSRRVQEYEKDPRMAAFDALDQGKQKNSLLAKSLAHLQEKLRQQGRQATSASMSLAEQESKLKELKSEIKGLQRELASAERQELRKFRLPQQRATSKVNILVILRRGRFYYISKMERGRITGYDERFVSVSSKNEYDIITSRENAGLALNSAEAIDAALRPVASREIAQRYFMDFAVYGDSIRQFAELKQKLNSRGMNYNWLPMRPEDTLVLTRGGSGTVQ